MSFEQASHVKKESIPEHVSDRVVKEITGILLQVKSITDCACRIEVTDTDTIDFYDSKDLGGDFALSGIEKEKFEKFANTVEATVNQWNITNEYFQNTDPLPVRLGIERDNELETIRIIPEKIVRTLN